jgi:cytochrome c oxidase cbb3-type subunit III
MVEIYRALAAEHALCYSFQLRLGECRATGGWQLGARVMAVRWWWFVSLWFVAWGLDAGAIHISRAAGQESQAAQGGPAPATQPAGSNTAASATVPVDLEQGKRLFVQNCSPCHGVNGGGEQGPDLRGVSSRLTDSEVQGIIRRGIPGTAMPGSFTVTERQAANIAAYVRTLGGTTAPEKITGDPKRGEALYASSGCATCHMIAGQGGSIGPELTRIGAMRGASNLKARLQDPGANLPKVDNGMFGNSWTQYLMFRAVDKDGRAIEGMRVGENSFTIVLKDAGGKFHGLWKPDLRSLEREPGKSLMPSFKDTLSAEQIDDVVAYLSTLKGAP